LFNTKQSLPDLLRTLGCGQSQDGCSAGWQARLRGQMEAITEILDTLAGKPGDVRQYGLHDVKTGHILVCQLSAFRHVDIFFGHHHPLP
ncbi:hypothetical protein E2I00_002983, partial [Balaenoptera physalus]